MSSSNPLLNPSSESSLLNELKPENSGEAVIKHSKNQEDYFSLINQMKISSLESEPERLMNKPRNDQLLQVLNELECAIGLDPIEKTSTYNVEHKINWLIDKGYVQLALKLKDKHGFPWNEIIKINSPILMEQLVDLYFLTTKKKANNVSAQAKQSILEFCISIAKQASADKLLSIYDFNTPIIHDAMMILGKTIFFASQNMLLASNLIKSSEMNQSLERIEQAFKEEIQRVKLLLQEHYEIHKKTGLQSAELAFHNKLPIEISRLLLTGIGSLNIGIIDLLIDFFVKEKDHPLNHEINLVYGLKLLQKSPQLRSKFDMIVSPPIENPASYVIKTSLELPPDHQLADIHAKQTALAALLSHKRQLPSGACFAEALAIELLSSHLEQCLDDFVELLKSGKLTRKVDGINMDFPFLISQVDVNLNHVVSINKKGQIESVLGSSSYLWEAPGIKAACLSIGIKDFKNAIQKILQTGFFAENASLNLFSKFTIKKILQALVLDVHEDCSDKETTLMPLLPKACFCFESQISNPLLEVWKNSIAGMAEAQESALVKSSVLNSASHALKIDFIDLTADQKKIKAKLYEGIDRELHERIQLQYDPYISHPSLSTDLHGVEGGFVLYDRNFSKNSSEWIRVDTPQAYQAFNLRIIEKIYAQLQNTMHIKDKGLDAMIKHLFEYIRTEGFIQRVLNHYNPSNKVYVNPLIQYEQIKFTPWITRCGNDSAKVIQIYLEQKAKTVSVLPSSSEQLLTKIIDLGKAIPIIEKKAYDHNPYKLIPLRTLGLHSFSLMLGHDSLANAWKSDCKTADWIQNYVIIPGKRISKEQIDLKFRQQMIDFCAQSMIDPNDIPAFLQQILNIPESIDYFDFRNRMLTIIHAFFPLQTKMSEIARIFDTYLCESLPKNLKKIMEESAVHFADTNWSDGIHDIHFCFAINPGTEKLEIWEVYDNGGRFVALDQNYWLLNRTWEFYCAPDEAQAKVRF